MKPSSLRDTIARATQTLAGAGVASPEVDARLLAAHLIGVPPMQLMFADAPTDFDEAYAKLIAPTRGSGAVAAHHRHSTVC